MSRMKTHAKTRAMGHKSMKSAGVAKMADGGAVNAHKDYAMGRDPLASQNAMDAGGKKSKFSKGGKC